MLLLSSLFCLFRHYKVDMILVFCSMRRGIILWFVMCWRSSMRYCYQAFRKPLHKKPVLSIGRRLLLRERHLTSKQERTDQFCFNGTSGRFDRNIVCPRSLILYLCSLLRCFCSIYLTVRHLLTCLLISIMN